MAIGNSRARLGQRLQKIRKAQQWTLKQVSERTGLAVSTLSKVENDQMSLTYDKLIQLSDGLGIDIGELFSGGKNTVAPAPPVARRSVTRAGEGKEIDTPHYWYSYLCTDLVNKSMVPVLGRLHTRCLEEFGDLIRHQGEEFIYVLHGKVALHTEHYEPLLLAAGDSAYFDSSMGHAYLNQGRGKARILVVHTGQQPEFLEKLATKMQLFT
jgi:transcriptional regulator with XRE-family HTH domain